MRWGVGVEEIGGETVGPASDLTTKIGTELPSICCYKYTGYDDGNMGRNRGRISNMVINR